MARFTPEPNYELNMHFEWIRRLLEVWGCLEMGTRIELFESLCHIAPVLPDNAHTFLVCIKCLLSPCLVGWKSRITQ